MNKKYIKPTHSLSTKLSLGILLMAIPIFVLALGILYVESRNFVKKEAMGHANSVLNTTMQRVCRYMTTVQTATDINAWQAIDNLHPDSLQAYSRFVVQMNGHTDGCSISMEPNVFPKYGRYFYSFFHRGSTYGAFGSVYNSSEPYVIGGIVYNLKISSHILYFLSVIEPVTAYNPVRNAASYHMLFYNV